MFVCLVAVLIVNTLSSNHSKNPKKEEVTPPVKEEEQVEEEKAPKETKFNIVFYSESIIEKEDYVSILADLYDDDMKKKDNTKVKIDSDTDIIVNGERISLNSLIYIVQSLAGEQIVFDGVLNEKENVLVSLSYEGDIGPSNSGEVEEEPLLEEPQKPNTQKPNTQKPNTQEPNTQEPNVEENTPIQNGVIDGI